LRPAGPGSISPSSSLLVGWSASARLQFVREVLAVKARARATVHAGRDGLLGEEGSGVNADAKHFPVKTKI
jgi:hypothetical protein